MSMISLLYNTVTLLFVLTVLKTGWQKKLSPQLSLSAAELLTIYVMLCLSTAIGGHMCVQILLPIISYAYAYATPENDWQSLFWHYIPSWTSVTDKRGLSNFFDGGSTFYPHFGAWHTPLLWWGTLSRCTVLGDAEYQLYLPKTVDRKREVKLSADPVARLRWRIRGVGFFAARRCGSGSESPAAIDLLNGINYLFPQVPRLSGIRAYDIADFFTVRPWNAITWFPIGIYPFACWIGVFHAVGVVVFLLVLLSVLASTPRVRECSRFVSTNSLMQTEQSFGAYPRVSASSQFGVRVDT